jgi:gliding motility-associated-like protein
MPDGTDTWMSYRWDFDDPLNNTGSVSRDGTHAYSVAKTYNVKLMVTSRDDCKDSLTQIYTDIYPQPKAGFISEDSLCLGTSINLKDSSTPFFGNISEWYWKLGDNSNNTLESIQHNYGNAGIFNIQHYIKTSIGCISDTASKLVNVYDYPKISAGPDLAVLDDGQKKIAATAGGKILSYQWSPSIYLSSKDSLQPVIVRPKNDQVYTLMVTGRGNCISRDEMNMKVVTLPKPPNTFTPNGDGINDTWEIQYLDQYPDCQVEVYTSSGQIIYRSTGYPRAWDGKSNGRDLPAGTYYFVIDPKNGRPKMAGYVQILK